MNRPGSSFHLRPLKNLNINVGSYEHKGYGFMDAKYNTNFLVDEKFGEKTTFIHEVATCSIS
jgi:hypothetical protein